MTEVINRAPLSPEAIAVNRARWAEALESGDYPQTHGALRGDDGYCCLGVAENLRGADWNQYELGSDDGAFWLVDRRIALVDASGEPVLRLERGWATQLVLGSFDSRQHAVLTGDGAHWLGLVETDPLVVIWDAHEWAYESLTHLNDDRGFDFTMIAAIVRDQPPTWDGSVHSVKADVDDRVNRNASPIVYPRGAR